MSEFTSVEEILESAAEYLPRKMVMEADALVEIARQISKKRIEGNESQRDFAQKLGITQGMLSRYESGNHNFTIKKLAEIFDKLDISFKIECSPVHLQISKLTNKWNLSNYTRDLSDYARDLSGYTRVLSEGVQNAS